MIIKGLFRRYKRWNPVHPTYGAFWGMGVGVGCGVGWGPGFGPEVIGYVGSGCGIGFNVGFTLAGFGIGLPANFIFEAPYNVIMATRNSALEVARSKGFNAPCNGWTINLSCVFDLQREASDKLHHFRERRLSVKGFDFLSMKNDLSLLATSACNSMRTFHDRLSSRRGKD